MLKIGLTGGIASGKSLASQYFRSLKIEVIDADLIAHQLFEAGSPHLTKLKNHFGGKVFTTSGELDRKLLRNIVFSDPKALAWLNAFTHPLVAIEMERELLASTSPYVVLDIPLLINKQGVIPEHLATKIDRVLVIESSVKTQLKRLTTRNSITTSDAMKIIETQSSWKQKIALADDVIENNGSTESLKTKIEELHQRYLSMLDK